MPHPNSAPQATILPNLATPHVPVVRHARLAETEERLLEELADPYGAPIPLLIGAPGAGKTTLLQLVMRQLLEAAAEDMRADPNRRPVIAIEAPPPKKGSFDWTEGLVSIQMKLGEAGLDWRLGDASDPDALLARQGLVRRARDLRQVLSDTVAALIACHTEVLFIDDVSHMAYVNDVERYQATADILKNLSNQTGVRIVCVGAYEALGYRNLSGQLIRRQAVIHLPRYRADVEREYAEFCRVATAMLEFIEFDGKPEALHEALYRGSIGAIGNLAKWLRQAAFRAQRRGERFERALVAKRTPDDGLEKMIKEALAGEEAMTPPPEVRLRLDEMLAIGGSAKKEPPPIKRQAQRRPGIRKITRDPVGVAGARG
jgi:hypothetical protein